MSKAVFFSIPAHGHTNPTLPLVKELVNNGEEIIYYSLEEFKDKIEATGAEYREYSFSKGFGKSEIGKNLASLYHDIVKTTACILDKLIDDINQIKPDYIIHDSISVWGRYAAAICGIPAISSISTFAFNSNVKNFRNSIVFFRKAGIKGIRDLKKAGQIQKEMYKRHGIAPQGFINSMMNEEPLNIVYNSEYFQPYSESFDKDKYRFIGPMIFGRDDDPDTEDYSRYPHPFIYVSMGTVWKEMYSIPDIIKSLSGLYGTLVLSGACDDDMKRTFPENVVVKKHVNQIEILKYTDLFVTHGGMNSVNEGLFNSVPLCVYPFQSEQEEVAFRIEELKCGIRLRNLQSKTIQKAITEIFKNSDYKNNCYKVSRSFLNAPGCKAASQEIITYLERATR